MNRKKILVRGPAMSLSGYGEQCRFALRALRAYEDVFDIYLVNIGWGETGFITEDDEERSWLDATLKKTIEYMQANPENRFDMSLQVTIPNEWDNLAPVNVGYTAGIETTKISPEWVQKSLEMDRIIVTSQHSKFGFDNTVYQAQNPQTGEVVPVKCNVPVEAVNYCTREVSAQKIDLKLDYEFNFLTMAQYGPRKNLDNTIRWFVEAFREQEVGLVVKAFTKTNSIIDRTYTEKRLQNLLSQYEDRKCKVYLVHGSMSTQELHGLYENKKIKALINLSHGEGFGLPMFEAAQSGLPIIAPAWSGHCDFLYGPVKNKKTKKVKVRPLFARVEYSMAPVQPEAVWNSVIQADSMWCYPQEKSYKSVLQEVVKDYSRFTGQARRLKKHIENTFTPENQYKQFAEFTFGQEIKRISKENLPKISVITSVYNGDEFIKPFMEDMTKQTIFDQCELIMVNANSPGNEEDVIREYMEKYDNIIYKKLEEDPGIYGTWNEALKLSTGEYITNANLDDRKAYNSLELHAKELFTNPEIDLVYADSFITNKPNETYESNSSNGRRYNFEQFSKQAMLRGNQPHNNPMWRQELHEKHGEFNDQYKSAGDWEFFLRCTSGGSKFKKINDVLGLYYFNPKGISTNFENYTWKQQEEQEIYTNYKEKLENEAVVVQPVPAKNSAKPQSSRQAQK